MTMQVKLIRYTGEPERAAALAARLCYSPVGVEELDEKLNEREVEDFVRKLVKLGHFSALEHVSFTFAVEGVSRVLTHQLVRHRIASYSQQSQRYVAERDFEYITPPTIAANAEALKRFEALLEEVKGVYNELVDMGINKEDARYVLPNATETKIVITMNTRSLLNFFSLRCCRRAQWEIRKLADKMLAEVRKVAPVLFEKAGPTCITHRICNEGKMSCGQLEALLVQDEVRGRG